MSDFPRSLLTTSISAALFFPVFSYATESPTSDETLITGNQCIAGAPTEDANQLPVNITADKLEAVKGNRATYKGHVVVTQGHKRMTADKVTQHQQENLVVAEGDVTFNDGTIKTKSDKATNNLNTNAITLENTEYHFLCQAGRGNAVYIAKTGKAMYEIEDGSITSCPDGDNSWQLRASSIEIDKNEDEATLYNPRMEIQGVPFFYLPILTVPIGNKRKTGFLYPTISYGSNNGLSLNIPFYWNIAPQYDLRTDIEHTNDIGTVFKNKFRYLTDFGQGTINYEYLSQDKKTPDEGKRWAFQYRHAGIYDEAWKFSVNYARVSDLNYFSDIDSTIGTRQDGQLVQEGQVTYRSEHWDLSLLSRDFQILTTGNNQPYRLMPQLSFNYYAPEAMRYLDFDLKSSIARFETDAVGEPQATRLHIEPGFKVPLTAPWGHWTTETRLLSTFYEQDLAGVDSSLGYDTSVSRILPEFKTNMGLVLEKDSPVFDSYTQTLEPQVQYLYIPKKDQSEIARYDTTLLQTDYYGLFRSRKYSSVDYVAPANQISYGATSRFFDGNYKERMNIAFGQIIYLNKSLKQQDSTSTNDVTNYSAWAVEMDFNYGDYLFYHGGIQYDVDTADTQLANSTLELRGEDGFIQTNYRYVAKDYIESTLNNTQNNSYSTVDVNTLTEEGISQIGLIGQYQISPKWGITSSYYYDLTTSQLLQWQTNLSYRSDCWYIGFTYSKDLNKWNPDFSSYPNAHPEFEENFGFNFGIVGFGTNVGAGYSLGTGSNSLSYTRPFFLKN